MALAARFLEDASRRFIVLFRTEPEGVLHAEIVAATEISRTARVLEQADGADRIFWDESAR
jgi:hypothetical protein